MHLPESTPASLAGSQINWLELARFAAEGEGHADLSRGVQRLATLAAAVHRAHIGQAAPAQNSQAAGLLEARREGAWR